MARDRPSPYGKGTRFFAPRDRGMARDRPSPYDEGTFFASPRSQHGEGQALALR